MFAKYYYKSLSLLALFMLSTCTPAAPALVEIPTLAVLPSATPSPTNLPSPTDTPLPTETSTPNLLETQVVQLNATNVAAEMTLSALLTLSAPTASPSTPLMPSLTITTTLMASITPPAVVPMQPVLLYAQSTANLRTCAHRDCEQIAQLQPGEAVMATGSIVGEAINNGKPLWYRVDYGGRELYVYSELVSPNAPVPPTNPPIFVPPPVSTISPPVGSVGCPSPSATCSSLTCEQAYACLAAGNASLDRDHDGVPCESVCNP